MSPSVHGAVSADRATPPTTRRPPAPDTPAPTGVGAAAARALRLAAALLGLVAIAGCLVVCLRRLDYPFALEWLEGNSLVEVHRILGGHGLYAAPSAAYVPDGYPPLYFAVCAAVARVTGLSYLPLRLVSLASSVVCFAVLARLVRRETASRCAGIAAAGMLAATYFATDTWFDVGRVDPLFLAFSVGALACARSARGAGGAVATGLLLAGAFLTKQNGLAEGVAVLAVLGLGGRRRIALLATAVYAAVLGLSTLILGATSHGWYVFYVFELMSEHGLNHVAFGGFWTAYLLPTLGLGLVALLLGLRRAPVVLLAGCAALVVEGYAALVHSGGAANDLLPAYLAVALLAGLALGPGAGMPTGRETPPRAARLGEAGAARVAAARRRVRGVRGIAGLDAAWHALSARQPRPVLAGALVVAQLALLITGFRPGAAVPTQADRAVGERVIAGLRTLGGPVLVPADPGLDVLAGLPAVAHQDATRDVLRATNPVAIARFTDSAARAVAARRYVAIVQERRNDFAGFPADLDRFYRRCPRPLLAGVPSRAFMPVAGVFVRPDWLWLPVGRGSCAAAVRAFDVAGTRTPSGGHT